MPSPLVSTSGTVPPALYNVKVVPSGKVPLVPTTMLKVSVPVPVFVTVLVKLTVEPGAAGPALMSLESVTAAVCVTVNGTVLEAGDRCSAIVVRRGRGVVQHARCRNVRRVVDLHLKGDRARLAWCDLSHGCHEGIAIQAG